MASSETRAPAGLEARARRAYEWGRWRAAAARAWPAAALTLVAVTARGRPLEVLAVGAALLAVMVVLGAVGGAWARAVRPGLLAGAAPLLLPLVGRAGHGCADGACWRVCLASCVAGGVLAGVLLGWRAARGAAADRAAWLAGGGAVAALTGSLGCAVAGTIGLAGMAAGFVLGAAPLVVLSVAGPRSGTRH